MRLVTSHWRTNLIPLGSLRLMIAVQFHYHVERAPDMNSDLCILRTATSLNLGTAR